MRKIFLLLAFSLAAGAAQAQIKCWNQDGKRVCGDTPPPGAKVTTMRGAASGPAEPAPAAKDAKKGPLTPAEQEQEYRKKQAEAQKAAEKQAAENKNAEAKRYNCAQAREALVTYESGQRIMRVRPDGERYFLDDAQIAQELAKSRQLVRENCN
jgi:hypothetical protein